MDDNSIIELYWQRDQTAVEHTSEKYGSYCGRIAMNILDDARDAEECVNDTWLRTWESIPPQRPDCLRAWLGRITRNLSLNRFAANRTTKRGSGQAVLALHELEDCVSGQESSDDERIVVQAIDEFVRKLRPRERQLFVLRYWQLEPVAGIAARCAMSVSNVTTVLYRLRKQLRTHLEQKGIDI